MRNNAPDIHNRDTHRAADYRGPYFLALGGEERVMIDYTKMDQLIIEKIKDGANTFSKIDGGSVYDEAKSIEMATGGDSFRVIDRRLQALRKRGVIEYTTKEKWRVS